MFFRGVMPLVPCHDHDQHCPPATWTEAVAMMCSSGLAPCCYVPLTPFRFQAVHLELMVPCTRCWWLVPGMENPEAHCDAPKGAPRHLSVASVVVVYVYCSPFTGRHSSIHIRRRATAVRRKAQTCCACSFPCGAPNNLDLLSLKTGNLGSIPAGTICSSQGWGTLNRQNAWCFSTVHATMIPAADMVMTRCAGNR